jgi:hypothetical protein
MKNVLLSVFLTILKRQSWLIFHSMRNSIGVKKRRE